MQLRPDIQSAVQECMDAYPEVPESRLIVEAYRIQFLTDSVKGLVGKTVLDLGCGAKYDADTNYSLYERYLRKGATIRSYQYDPWYCRLLEIMGANPIGVDIADNTTELFKSYRIDLTKQNALNTIDEESVDFANNACCTVPKNSQLAKTYTSPTIQEQYMNDGQPNYQAVWELNDHITEQVGRILQEGGLYTVAEFAYRKEAGKLEFLGKQKELL